MPDPSSSPAKLRPRARWTPVFIHAALFVVVSAMLRGVLVWKFSPDILRDFSALAHTFGIGLLLDTAVAGVLFLPVAVVTFLVPDTWLQRNWLRRMGLAMLWLLWVVLGFLFQSEYFFFEEYSSRFNTVAIDYLHYFTEVSGNLAAVYPVKTVLALSVIFAAATVFFIHRGVRLKPGISTAHRFTALGGWMAGTAMLLFAVTRVDFHASAQRVANELASNGLVSGSIAMWTHDLEYAHFFPTLARREAYARARNLLDSPGAIWSTASDSLQRRIPGDPTRPRLNVILLIQESFGSEFWGTLNRHQGRLPKHSLTPKLDQLAEEEGMLFTHLLADGNRTVRGLEGILASFPPLPGDAILARHQSQGLDTLASVLARDGYSTTFVYPGRGLFDDMKPFMLANGFQRFIEGGDFTKPRFSTVWGHSDEDLYDRVIEEARLAHEQQRPFLITTMSVSNHQPFEFSPGTVPNRLHGHKAGAFYSDHALGEFFKRAKAEPFWNDTIFAVIADHGARVYGSETVPVRSYEIPLLVLGPSAAGSPQRIATPGCQLDVAPTLLGIIGRPYDTVFYGRNLLAPASQRFALLNHNRSVGIYRDPDLIALSLGHVVESFVRQNDNILTRRDMTDADRDLASDAVALFQTADDLYRRHRYAPSPVPPATPSLSSSIQTPVFK